MATAQEILERVQQTKPQGTTQPGSIRREGSFADTSSVKRTGTLSPKNELDTSEGLYSLARQNGLQRQADSILAKQSGEETKKIFSGGFISDIFDVVNALQYGTTGVLKGKSFAEGVKTRQSFTDKDALGDKGVPGLVGGIALDIAVDPLTYIAPWTVVRKVPFLSKIAKASKEALFGKAVTKEIIDATGKVSKTYQGVEGGTKIGQYAVQKLAWAAGKDPIFMKTFNRSIRNTAVSTQSVIKMGKVVANLTPDIAKKILRVGTDNRFIRETPEVLAKTLPPKAFNAVQDLYKTIDDLGAEAVDLGLLSKSKYEENLGQYVKNAYLEFEQANKKLPFGFAKTGIKGIKKRVEGLSPERMLELGQIDNPAYLLMKSAIDLTRDVENAKLFREVNKRFGTDVAQEGFTKMSDTLRVGQLAGKYVPTHMAEYINMIVPPKTSALGELEKKVVGNFKFFKVVMNPGTHARNIISNKILNYWKLGMNPLDPRTIKAEVTALKEIVKGGGKWTDEAIPHGYNLDTYASAELKDLLETLEMAAGMKGVTNKWAIIKKKLGDIYQAEENQAKLSAYIYQRTVKKLNPEAAWLAAESATFNYAQVTPFIRKLRESIFGFPFITFTYKATPLAIETALKNPARIGAIGKIKQTIENGADIEETDRERASEPSWVKDGFYIKIPGKDPEGRSRYFDLTYILPFGDLVAGNFFERGQNTETGTPESVATATLKKSPFLQLVGELSKNKDFYGNSIMKDSDPVEKQMKDLFIHLLKTMAPPPLAEQLPAGYNRQGERQYRGVVGAEGAEGNQKRTLAQELARNFGVKIQPIDADIQETYAEWNKKKGLETLLKESGILSDFNIKYVPKND